MGKDFLNLKTEPKKLYVLLICVGSILTAAQGMKAFRSTNLQNDYELPRNEAGEGAYDQELIAFIGEQKVPVTVEVTEQKLSEEEAQNMLTLAAAALGDILKAENESLSQITTGIDFVDVIPGTAVEVEWTEKLPDYFYSDGTMREELEIFEPTEQMVSAVLSCQEYTKNYETMITILPRQPAIARAVLKQIEKDSETGQQGNVMVLPNTYKGDSVVWKKPMDLTFLYFGLLTAASVIFLKVGSKRDARIRKKERQEALERDYAQIVSKFTMLLSAGLSVRNAWERIVMLNRGKPESNRPVYREMNWALREMQKGVAELEVYEKFSVRVEQVHYKKLMALFSSDKRRGSINLLEAMEQEMLQAWEEQKKKTKQQGEKTGTKLLLPMMGMLAVVFIMILVPAFLSFQL